MYTGKNRPIRGKESRNRNLMRLSEQSFELVSVFKEASRHFYTIFLMSGKKFKNHLRMSKNTALIYRPSNKKYLSGDKIAKAKNSSVNYLFRYVFQIPNNNSCLAQWIMSNHVVISLLRRTSSGSEHCKRLILSVFK
jgi:hypothetical protein